MYLFRYVSAFFWFQWPHCETWQFVCACARAIQAIQKFWTTNRVDWWLINVILSCLFQICENAQCKLEKKFTNKIYVSDGIDVIKRAVNARCETVLMTTIMLQSSIHPTISLCNQTWCTWSTFWKLFMVGHANRREGTAYGKVRMLGYMNEKLVYGSTCGKLPAESAGMWQRYIIHHSQKMCISGWEIEKPQSFWMQLSIHTNYTLAVNNDYTIICTKLLPIQQQLGHDYGSFNGASMIFGLVSRLIGKQFARCYS